MSKIINNDDDELTNSQDMLDGESITCSYIEHHKFDNAWTLVDNLQSYCSSNGVPIFNNNKTFQIIYEHIQ
jgi:hypothetical protein